MRDNLDRFSVGQGDGFHGGTFGIMIVAKQIHSKGSMMETLFNNINFERYYNVLTLLSAIVFLYAIAWPTVYVDRPLLIIFSLGFFTIGLSEIINHRMEKKYKYGKQVPINLMSGERLGNGINIRMKDGEELVRHFTPLGIFMLLIGVSIILYGVNKIFLFF